MKRFGVFTLALVLSGCAPSVNVVMLSRAYPNNESSQIEVFYNSERPAWRYIKVAIVKVHSSKNTEAWSAIVQRAKTMGVHGIIITLVKAHRDIVYVEVNGTSYPITTPNVFLRCVFIAKM